MADRDLLTATSSDTPIPSDPHCEEDSLVCYCYRLTTKDLKNAHHRLGSLHEVERQTKAGTACGGCKIVLNSLFQEAPLDPNKLDQKPVLGTLCSKPGRYAMKGFIVANGVIESRVHASNGVAPQLGDCDTTTTIQYQLLDNSGKPVVEEERILAKNETFVFDTTELNLPRPFHGMFTLALSRSNMGATRFNVYWRTPECVTATHELSATGRPRVFIPFLVDQQFLGSANTVYLGVMNPHDSRVDYSLSVIDVDRREEFKWSSSLDSNCTSWIDTNKQLFGPVLADRPNSRLALRIDTDSYDIYKALSSYFFTHNKATNLWNCNHL